MGNQGFDEGEGGDDGACSFGGVLVGSSEKGIDENRIVTELVADHLRVNRSRKRDLDKLNDSGFQPGTDGLRVHLHELLDKGGNCDMCCVTGEEREMDVTEHPCQLRGDEFGGAFWVIHHRDSA